MRLSEFIFFFSFLLPGLGLSLLDLSWFMPLSLCLVPLVGWFILVQNHFMILDAQIFSRSFETLRSWSLGPLRHFYDPHDTFTTFTTPSRPSRQPTDIILWCLVCDGGGLHLSGRSGNNGISDDPAIWLLLHDTSCFFSRKFVSCLRGSCLENTDLIELQFILYDSRRCQWIFQNCGRYCILFIILWVISMLRGLHGAHRSWVQIISISCTDDLIFWTTNERTYFKCTNARTIRLT